jgi:hypothetical protein
MWMVFRAVHGHVLDPYQRETLDTRKVRLQYLKICFPLQLYVSPSP